MSVFKSSKTLLCSCETLFIMTNPDTVKSVIEAPLGETFCEKGAFIKKPVFLISQT